jgi:uncharacterized Zn finger protein
METLLAQGHADELVALGAELLEAGTSRVEMSHDEGLTAEAIASCLDVVFRALTHSSLPAADQMLWAVEAELQDEYDLCRGAAVFWAREQAATDCNILAEKLTDRLKHFKAPRGEDSFFRNYRRDRLANWLISALENAGRQEEIIPLCMHEAEETASYVRLVDYLKAAERRQEAEHWIHRGIKATQQQWPGIANELWAALQQIREHENDWLRLAAMRAEDFFPTANAAELSGITTSGRASWSLGSGEAGRHVLPRNRPTSQGHATRQKRSDHSPVASAGCRSDACRHHLS